MARYISVVEQVINSPYVYVGVGYEYVTLEQAFTAGYYSVVLAGDYVMSNTDVFNQQTTYNITIVNSLTLNGINAAGTNPMIINIFGPGSLIFTGALVISGTNTSAQIRIYECPIGVTTLAFNALSNELYNCDVGGSGSVSFTASSVDSSTVLDNCTFGLDAYIFRPTTASHNVIITSCEFTANALVKCNRQTVNGLFDFNGLLEISQSLFSNFVILPDYVVFPYRVYTPPLNLSNCVITTFSTDNLNPGFLCNTSIVTCSIGSSLGYFPNCELVDLTNTTLTEPSNVTLMDGVTLYQVSFASLFTVTNASRLAFSGCKFFGGLELTTATICSLDNNSATLFQGTTWNECNVTSNQVISIAVGTYNYASIKDNIVNTIAVTNMSKATISGHDSVSSIGVDTCNDVIITNNIQCNIGINNGTNVIVNNNQFDGSEFQLTGIVSVFAFNNNTSSVDYTTVINNINNFTFSSNVLISPNITTSSNGILTGNVIHSPISTGFSTNVVENNNLVV